MFDIFSQKFEPKPQYLPKNEIRPLFVNMTAHGAGRGRSPLLSLMFPTVRDKVAILEKEKVINQADLLK